MCMIFHKKIFQCVTAPIPLFQTPQKIGLLNRLFAIKTWWLEKEHFKYGAHAYNNLTAVGHYTQLVWAATHRVGCVLNTCKMRQNGKVLPYYTYICNYCPM